MPQSMVRRFLRHGMLPQLSVFESCARLGSFTRAAEELHLAQPTVSTQIKKLSDTLGLPLFEQIGKKVHLTPAGAALRDGCRELFSAFGRIEESLASLRGLEGGRLRLAVSTTGKYFAPRLLAAFVGLHPKIEVSLQIHNRQGLIDRLARNEDDLYIFANPPAEQEVVCQPILANPMVLFARADHPLAGRKRIPAAALAAEPYLMREPGSGTRLVSYDFFDRHAIEPRVRMELSTNEAIKQAILAGLGVSILSRYTLGLDTEQSQLSVLDIEGLPIERQWQFAYPVGKQVAPAARAFMDFVRAEAKHLVQDHLGHDKSE
jgi:LysR family transcriptional regulator, low CO2-responsive transcriptional regulator